jgi:oligosaccharide repeat unit polymerase
MKGGIVVMLFLLLVALILLLLVAYVIMRQDILSPWVISIYMFIITVAVATLNYSKWNEDISSITVLSVLVALIFFGAGEIVGRSFLTQFSISHNSKDYSILSSNQYIRIKKRYIFVTIAVISMVIYFHYNHILSLARQVGFSSSMHNLLYYVRIAQFSPEIDSSRSGLLNLGLTFSTVISYFFIFVFMFNFIISEHKKKYYRYLIPGLLNVINIVLTTGRTQFINLATFILILLFFMLKHKYKWSTRLNNKILTYGIIGVILFLVIFRMSGYLTGKSESLSLWDNISIYLGSPIIALSKYFESPPERFLFGSETFYSIYHILRKFGFDIPQYDLIHSFISWDSVSNVNIYTSIRRYIHDFGFLGMSIMMFSLGLFYGFFYKYVKIKRNVDLRTVVYAMYFFPITQIALEERFFTNIVSIQGVYNLTFIFLIWKYFIKEKNLVTNRC